MRRSKSEKLVVLFFEVHRAREWVFSFGYNQTRPKPDIGGEEGALLKHDFTVMPLSRRLRLSPIAPQINEYKQIGSGRVGFVGAYTFD